MLNQLTQQGIKTELRPQSIASPQSPSKQSPESMGSKPITRIPALEPKLLPLIKQIILDALLKTGVMHEIQPDFGSTVVKLLPPMSTSESELLIQALSQLLTPILGNAKEAHEMAIQMIPELISIAKVVHCTALQAAPISTQLLSTQEKQAMHARFQESKKHIETHMAQEPLSKIQLTVDATPSLLIHSKSQDLNKDAIDAMVLAAKLLCENNPRTVIKINGFEENIRRALKEALLLEGVSVDLASYYD